MAPTHDRQSPGVLHGARPIKVVFIVAGHLFIFLALLLISTLAGVPLPAGIGLALLGYLNVLCVVQAVLHTLRRGLTLPRLLLAFAYSIGGLVPVLLVMRVYSFPLHVASNTEGSAVNTALPILTALTGLVTAVSGIIAQVTARQKTLAEIERDVALLDIERQKLQLERERLQLEQEKGAGAGIGKEEQDTE